MDIYIVEEFFDFDGWETMNEFPDLDTATKWVQDRLERQPGSEVRILKLIYCN